MRTCFLNLNRHSADPGLGFRFGKVPSTSSFIPAPRGEGWDVYYCPLAFLGFS